MGRSLKNCGTIHYCITQCNIVFFTVKIKYESITCEKENNKYKNIHLSSKRKQFVQFLLKYYYIHSPTTVTTEYPFRVLKTHNSK